MIVLRFDVRIYYSERLRHRWGICSIAAGDGTQKGRRREREQTSFFPRPSRRFIFAIRRRKGGGCVGGGDGNDVSDDAISMCGLSPQTESEVS